MLLTRLIFGFSDQAVNMDFSVFFFLEKFNFVFKTSKTATSINDRFYLENNATNYKGT